MRYLRNGGTAPNPPSAGALWCVCGGKWERKAAKRSQKKKIIAKNFFWGMAWGRGAARGERKAPLSTTKGKGEIMTLPPPPNNKADQMGGK